MPADCYCLNGHYLGEEPRPYIVEEVVEQGEFLPEWIPLPRFCTQCASRTIAACESREAKISSSRLRPNYCGECAQAFPWTVAGLQAAEDFTDDLENLSSEEKTALKKLLPNLLKETSGTPMETERFKRYLTKMGPEAGKSLLKMVIDLATDAAKKHLDLSP